MDAMKLEIRTPQCFQAFIATLLSAPGSGFNARSRDFTRARDLEHWTVYYTKDDSAYS